MTTQLTVATLNIRGLPLKGTRVAGRFAAIAAELDSSKIDLICLQEVFDYYHLRLLRQGMPSFTQVAYRPSLAGPRGGLVTLSRQPLSDTAYIKLPQPSRRSGLPVRARVNALHSGLLAVHLAGSRIRVLNVHPAANTDGDWSEHNRFRQLQGDQLTALGQVVKANMATTVVCGDFNVARISTLHHALPSCHAPGLQLQTDSSDPSLAGQEVTAAVSEFRQPSEAERPKRLPSRSSLR
ncbi:endonuclease/exonuclease/phosphatase family metal-dependent hydrolase [Kribbella rubisoli]|uniref:Endonuclease/exonuclease/phosphatase family metal-dependent hydrolase n=1 Tax=Kribbella rubisoli TaxID=3075929 RepID=A0A4Q7WTM7_9ACTN|nr:endonuclease/exonuclease/phosphatase family protein [Kribbella rubisoli]RZU12689.1 endonuclease/exonuclease/phosphatase family metal-dependent hydrolase [Kribbella rubisoli]